MSDLELQPGDNAAFRDRELLLMVGSLSLDLETALELYDLLIGRRAELVRTERDATRRQSCTFDFSEAIRNLEPKIMHMLRGGNTQLLLKILEEKSLQSVFFPLVSQILREREAVLCLDRSSNASTLSRIRSVTEMLRQKISQVG